MKNALTLLIILCVGNAIAQPVLTKATNEPAVGESFELASFFWDGVVPDSGEYVIWDYSDIETFGEPKTRYFVDKTASDDYEDYPDATIAQTEIGEVYKFESYTDDASYNLGYVESYTPAQVVYSNPELQMVYPMTYLTTATDSFASTVTNPEIDYSTYGKVSLKGMGYGPLLLPGVTKSNVLLVKKRAYIIEVTADGSSWQEIQHYFFFTPGVAFPLLTLTYTYSEGAPTSFEYGEFNNSPTLSSAGDNTENSFTVYPNPVQDVLIIQTTNTDEIQAVAIYTISGRLVYSDDAFVNSISTAELNSGIYYVEITTESGTAVEKFVKR